MAPHFKKLSTTTSSSMSSALSLLFSRSSRTHFLVISLPLLFLVFFFFTSQTNNSSASFFSISTLRVRLLLAANYVSPFSSITSSDSCLVSDSRDNCTLSSVTAMERRRKISRKQETDFGDDDDVIAELSSCDIFDGNWVVDDSDPIYPPGSCPFVDDAFNCFKNGRPDMDYIRYKWKPHGCQIPRFDGRKMLGMLRGKRVVFVGDSLNRNMWESLVCGLRESLENKSRIFEVSGRTDVKFKGFYSFKFMDYECSVEFIKAPFLVEEWKTAEKDGNGRETLRLDRIHATPSKYHDADIIIFNTGHWWTHQKTNKGKDYFQEGGNVYSKLEVSEAYTKALQTWAKWVDANINSSRTRIFFRGYSASHFRRGEWNSGGQCHGERQPITNETHLAPYPWMMNILESVISEMKTPVFYLNVTKLTDYRKDGHPSIYRRQQQQQQPQPEMKIRSLRRGGRLIQDCSHWCLPGVPDSWNQLLYSTLLLSPDHFSTSH